MSLLFTRAVNDMNRSVHTASGTLVGYLLLHTIRSKGWSFASLVDCLPNGEQHWPSWGEALGEVAVHWPQPNH